MSPLAISSISTEYVHVAFTATGGTVTGVELALVAPGVLPAAEDWHTAVFADGTATILIGPDGGVITLAADTMYVLWLRADAGTEHPARPTGYVLAYDQVPA